MAKATKQARKPGFGRRKPLVLQVSEQLRRALFHIRAELAMLACFLSQPGREGFRKKEILRESNCR
jgi:hypothetical protein